MNCRRKSDEEYLSRHNDTLHEYRFVKEDEDGFVLPESREFAAKLNAEMKKQSEAIDDKEKWQGIEWKSQYDWRNG